MLSTLISFGELFVLPALAALAAAWLMPTEIATSLGRRAARVALLCIAAFGCAYLLRYARDRASRPLIVRGGDNVSINLNRQHAEIELTYTALVVGSSSNDDIISGIAAELKSVSPYSSLSVPFTETDIACHQKGELLTVPIHVGSLEPLSLSCSLKQHLNVSALTLWNSDTNWELNLHYYTQAGVTIQQRYCFRTSPDLWRGTPISVERKFLDAHC